MFRLIAVTLSVAGTLNPASRPEIDDIINFLANQNGFIEIGQSK